MSREAINVEWLSCHLSSGDRYSWVCPICQTTNKKIYKIHNLRTKYIECNSCKTTVKIEFPKPPKMKARMHEEL